MIFAEICVKIHIMNQRVQGLAPNIPSWWPKREGKLFALFCEYQKIGECCFCISKDQQIPKEKQHLFPSSWFFDRRKVTLKPVLEITGLLTEKNRGNGRLCLQALYERSVYEGCEGRMQLIANFDSGCIYEHCGFKGEEQGKDGLKYFDPTPENIQSLFSKTESQDGKKRKNEREKRFRLIPLPTPRSSQRKNSSSDHELFERMLNKARERLL